MVEVKRVTSRINSDLVEKNGKEKAETSIRKNIETIKNNLNKRKRLDVDLSHDLHLKIHNIKQKTGYPKWYIIEKCIQYEKNKGSEKSEVTETDDFQGVEPESCPNCGAGSDELLISHADSTYYCYECGNRDEY